MKYNTVIVPEDAVLLATFGRMTKCDKPEYLEALARILEAEPNKWLILAGRDNFGVVPSMEEHFRTHGVADRVRYLGPRQEDGPRLLKTVDIYCDTYPWPGGQSLGDAMQAGLPVVAMRRAKDPDLDPTGWGPTTAVAEALLEGVLELTPAGGVDDYVRIARAYIGDPELRVQAGHLDHGSALGVQRALALYGISGPLVITGGYRSPQTNADTEGAAGNSQHLYAKAVDMYVPCGCASFSMRAGRAGCPGASGYYCTHVHLDSGSRRWWVGDVRGVPS